MTSPIGGSSGGGSNATAGQVQGISSGIQWRDMVDLIMKAEQARTLDPVTAQITKADKSATTWNNFQTTMGAVRDAASTLRDPTTFDAFTATAGKSPTTQRDLLTASAATGAAPGIYSVEVMALAKAEKLSSNVVAKTDTALGYTGSFALNGKQVSLVASDTLTSIRDKINAANSGTLPSNVSAAILASGAGSRLILTSVVSGGAGIATVDDAAGTFRTLGFTDSTSKANITATGATQTYPLSSSTSSVGSLLGLTMPAAASILVGGHTVAVDLSTDTLTTLADKINTAMGSSSAASVQSETIAGKTYYRLITDAAVAGDASINLSNSTRALAVLGFTTPGHAGIAQVLNSANSFTDSGTSLPITTASLLSALQTGGGSLGVGNGDTLNITGTRGDGTAVSTTLAVTGATTVQQLLDAINASGTGFGGGTRSATASISGGRLVLTDGTTGDSQLSLSITDSTAGGDTISVGAISATSGSGTIGRSRQVSAGSDAVIRIDGQVVRRASNTIADASVGLTLNLLTAEVGTTVEVTVSRDTEKLTAAITAFSTAYNKVRQFVTTNTGKGQALEGSTALRSMGSALTSELIRPVVGLVGALVTASQAGLQHDKNGTLTLDGETFKKYLQSNFTDVRKLFARIGTPSDPEVSYVSAGDKTAASTTPFAVNVTQAATMGSATGSIWTTYATAGTPDTMSVTDVATGAVGTILMANGDSIDTIVSRLNGMFGAKSMHLAASKTVDSRVKIAASDYGTTGGFTIAYTPGTGGDGTAALGLAAGTTNGLDVGGTINGFAATGKGQFLTGGVGDASEGLILQYTGTTARTAGTVMLTLGVGGALAKVAAGMTTENSGSIATIATNEQTRSASLSTRSVKIQNRLDTHRAALMKKFSAMEQAMTKIQQMGALLSFPRSY